MVNDILWIVLLLALAAQLIYILFIFPRLSFFNRNKISTNKTHTSEGVSVIVCAHNEKEHLENLIPILCSQDYANYEVIIINDRSLDGTRTLLDDMTMQHPRLRTVTVKYTPDHVTSKKYALTLGIKIAKNNVLLLTDVDCVPKSDQWIRLMTSPVREDGKTFALGYSPYKKEPGILNKWIQYETAWTGLLYFSFALWGAPFMGVGRNLCYRKDFFIEKKAFKDLWKIDCGDDDLFINKYANSNNTAVVINAESITLSEPKTTWKSYFRQKKRHFHAGKYYKAKDKLKIGLYSFSHILFWWSAVALGLFLGLKQNWEQFWLIMGIIIVRSLLLTSIVTLARKKLDGNTKVFWTFLYDVIYQGYFWIVGTLGYKSKKVKWK